MRKVFKSAPALRIFLIAATVFLAYFNALSNSFVYDDVALVQFNSVVKGLHNVFKIFSTGYWTGMGGHSGGLYRPVALFSFTLEYTAAGLKPFIYHLDNLILHALCSVLVYLVLKAVLKEETVPLLSALIFAVHPVHTEAVAWVSGRAELLSVFFGLLSAWIFLEKHEGRYRFFLLFVTFLLALLSKETAITIPIILAVYMVLYETSYPGRALPPRLALRLLPFIAAFTVYMAARAYFLGGEIIPPDGLPLYGVKPYYRFLIMSRAFFEYIRLCFFPTDLSPDYFIPLPKLLDFKTLFPLAVLVSAAAFAPRMFRSRRHILFAVLWFFITLIPVSNIILVGVTMSERALYLPSVGACMLLGIAFSRLFSASFAAKGWNRASALLLLGAVLVLFTAMTVNRNPFWRDQKQFLSTFAETMRRRTERYPSNAAAFVSLGKACIANDDYGSVPEGAFKKAVEIEPDNFVAHYNLARMYEHNGRFNEALEEYQTTIKMRPIAEAYDSAGQTLYKLGRKEQSEKMIDEAIRLNPYNSNYYLDKGVIRMDLGDETAALRLFDKAISLDPENAQARLRKGIMLGTKREFRQAVEEMKKVVELLPEGPEGHYYLAVAYTGEGLIDEAAGELRTALKLRPDYKDASDLQQILQSRR